jgi:membrane-bound serine protease (ClpP class)
MAFLIQPNIAYLLVLTGVLLLLLTIDESKFTLTKAGMVLCFLAGLYAFISLKGNAWAFLMVALSPLPYFVAIRGRRGHKPLFLLTLIMLALGGVYLFVDGDGRPAVDDGLAGVVSVVYGCFLWIGTERMRNVEGLRPSEDPGSLVGLLGEVRTDIEAHSTGSVFVEGEVWQARSQQPIPAGRTVRVLRQDGFVLTVKEAPKLTKKRDRDS